MQKKDIFILEDVFLLSFLLNDSSDCYVRSVQSVRCIFDSALWIWSTIGSMYNYSVSCQDCHMSGIYDAITGLMILPAYASTRVCLCITGTRQAVTKVCKYLLCKSRTVNTVCQAVSSIYIWISNKLACLSNHCCSYGTVIGITSASTCICVLC